MFEVMLVPYAGICISFSRHHNVRLFAFNRTTRAPPIRENLLSRPKECYHSDHV